MIILSLFSQLRFSPNPSEVNETCLTYNWPYMGLTDSNDKWRGLLMYKSISVLCSSGTATQYSLSLKKCATATQRRKRNDKLLGDHSSHKKEVKEEPHGWNQTFWNSYRIALKSLEIIKMSASDLFIFSQEVYTN